MKTKQLISVIIGFFALNSLTFAQNIDKTEQTNIKISVVNISKTAEDESAFIYTDPYMKLNAKNELFETKSSKALEVSVS